MQYFGRFFLVVAVVFSSAIRGYSQFSYQNIPGDTSGYTPGNFNVTDGGAASYSVPIIISPGSSGMQPQISIAYSSQGGNGLMGQGWSLQGLSAITRAQQTIAQDGRNKGITFTSEDRYALDGERLIITDQGVTYGSSGAEYRTEQNAFYKIISYGNIGGGVPSYFKVWTNAGLIMEYGNSSDSRIDVNGSSPLFWLLNKVTDTKGNYYTISYQKNALTGEYIPLRIDYTGNVAAGIVPYASVRFEYEARPDSTRKYLAGIQISSSTKRLRSIKSYFGNTLVRSYIFNYQLSPAKLSQLISLKECGTDGSCHDATTFTWKNISSFSFYPFSVNNLGITSDDNISSIDLNGDGVQDIIKIKTFSGGKTTPVQVFTSNKDQNNLAFQNGTITPSILNDSALIFSDFNGDGKTDIFQYAKVSGASRIYFNTTLINSNSITFNSVTSQISNSLLNNQNIIIPADFNADGRSDILCFNPANGNNYWLFSKMTGLTASSFEMNGGVNYFQNLIPTTYFNNGSIKPLFADFNSDGLVDILFWNKATGVLNYYQNQGGTAVSFTSMSVSGISSSQIIGGNNADILTNDLNADGLPDLLYWDKSSGVNRLWINKGDNNFIFTTIAFAPSLSSFVSATQNSDFLLPIDFNADGLNDYVAIFKSSGQVRWLRNEGQFTFNWINYSGNNGSPTLDAIQIQNYDFQSIGNYTSRSMMDMLFLNKSASSQLRVFRGVNDYNNLVSKITSGSGQVIDIAYEFMTSDSVYSKNDNAVYPLMDYQATQFVVKSYTTDDGVGGKRSMDYRYIGAKLHLNGRGFRGYSEVHMTDRSTGIVQSKYFVNDTSSYKYIRSPLVKNVTRLPNGVSINIVNYENEFKSFYNGRCSYSYVKRNRSVNFEIDGKYVDSSVTSWDYDDYGNAIRTVTDHGDGFKDSLVNVYANNPATWIIGRLQRSDLYRWAPGGLTARKSSAFEYDPVTGILTKEIIEPDSSSNVRIEKTYNYDNFGNILKSSTTAWNGTVIQTRSNITSYDPLGRFILKISNDLGHSISKTYDQLLGSETSVTDQNGLTYTSSYDGFGRKIKTQMPDGNWSRLDYRNCGNGLNCPALAYHAIIEQSSINPKAVKYYDLYNKELRSEKVGFSGTVIYEDNIYNSRNLLFKKSNPYYANETPVWTIYTYDISGRKITTVYPGNRKDSVIYRGRTNTFINPKGQHKILIKNSKDQLITSRDHYGKDISYTYDAKGNLLKITDPKGNEISMSYDVYGNKISMTDPDLGTYKYVYNRFGELIEQTDPKNNSVNFEYDLLGRITKQIEPEGTSLWTYDTRPNGKGLVAKISNYNNYAISYDYDNLGRKIKETQVIGGSAFIQQYTFDSLGRAKQTTYPSGLSIVNEYNNYGFLYRIKNSSSNKIYWQINELTALEQITKQLYGNGLTVNREFDKNTNFLTSINTQNGKGNQQNLGFNYDVIGNLTERKDLLQNKQEIFEYDALNRLLKAKIAGADSLSMLYDELGNITYKSDVGNYHYGSVNNGPHQLNSIDLTTKQCIPGLQINTEYYSFNKVKSVSKDSNLIEVYYNNGRQRILQKKYVGNKLVRTKIYVSPIFEKEITNTDTTEIHYIKGAEGTIAVFETKKKNNKVAAFLTYLHRDHIGSVVMLTSDSGYILANYSYDAWGKRRNSNWTNSIPDTTLLKNERGFTGHEHYDLFELIDMNGRIYDPTLGCFLSPDPFIQDPSNLQNLNRYCYVVNNPLSLVDPSGHFFGAFSLSKIGGFISNWGSIFRTIGGVISEIGKFQEHVASVAGQWVKENYKTIIVAAIAITASVLTAGALAGCSYLLIATVSGAAAGFASGVSATLINGGNLKDALLAGGRGAIIGAATSAATFGVGRLAETAGSSMGSVGSFGVKVIGHGAVQGASNVVQGGKFSHGFFSGAVSGAVSPTVAEKFDSKIAQIAVASVAGGTTSAICGGKFANGAVTGAFVMMYSSSLKDAITEKDPITKALENWKPDPKESITLASNVDIPTSMARGAVWGAAISGLAMEVGVITVTAATPVGWIIIGSAAVGAGINLYRSNMDFTSKTLESIDKAMKP